MWRSAPYGHGSACVWDSINSNAYEFMRAHIYFANNHKGVLRGEPGYYPHFKVRWFMNAVMKAIHCVWTGGQNITIDKIMIRYNGWAWAIKWVQYMPVKPVKHGIKVFAECCAYTYTIGI